MKVWLFVTLCFSTCLLTIEGRHPTCNFLLEVERDRAECLRRLREEEAASSHKESGCSGAWDSIACWGRAEIGEIITISCPRVLKTLFGRNGNISRNCTSAGWSDVFPNINSVCGSDPNQDKLVFYVVVQTLYTLGHSLSLIALTTGSAILCLFRKLHCTRNYIHLNLFFSFILRAVAVLVKDDILFNRNSPCSNQPSLVRSPRLSSLSRVLRTGSCVLVLTAQPSQLLPATVCGGK